MKQCLVLDQNAGINLIRTHFIASYLFFRPPFSFFYGCGA